MNQITIEQVRKLNEKAKKKLIFWTQVESETAVIKFANESKMLELIQEADESESDCTNEEEEEESEQLVTDSEPSATTTTTPKPPQSIPIKINLIRTPFGSAIQSQPPAQPVTVVDRFKDAEFKEFLDYIEDKYPVAEYIYKGEHDFRMVVDQENLKPDSKQVYTYHIRVQNDKTWRVVNKGTTRALNHRNALIRAAHQKHYGIIKPFLNIGKKVEVHLVDPRGAVRKFEYKM